MSKMGKGRKWNLLNTQLSTSCMEYFQFNEVVLLSPFYIRYNRDIQTKYLAQVKCNWERWDPNSELSTSKPSSTLLHASKLNSDNHNKNKE
jgi:hypothetical protein